MIRGDQPQNVPKPNTPLNKVLKPTDPRSALSKGYKGIPNKKFFWVYPLVLSASLLRHLALRRGRRGPDEPGQKLLGYSVQIGKSADVE